MGDPKIRAPRLRVIWPGHEDVEVQTANPDFLRWDLTRAKHRWPVIQEAPFMWMTFMAWAAATRTGAIPPDVKWERWADEVLDVQVVKDPEEPEADVVDPFRLAPEAG